MIANAPLLGFCCVGLLLLPSHGFSVHPQQLQLQRPSSFLSRPPSTIHLHNTAGDTTAESHQSDDEKKLSLDTVAELIDTTFVNACLQLAKGYVDVLKLLIVAIKSGYEMGIAPLDLIHGVDAVESKAAGRELMAEELRLRNTWIQVVYTVLSHVGYESVNAGVHETIDESVASWYRSKIPALMTRKKAGQPFNTDDLVDKNSVIADPAASIIMTQSLRVIWFTLVVLEEEERCISEFARQDAPMRPPIPGAY